MDVIHERPGCPVVDRPEHTEVGADVDDGRGVGAVELGFSPNISRDIASNTTTRNQLSVALQWAFDSS